MNPDIHQLDEVFSSHEVLAPDADTVLARSHDIARHLKRRQWAVRATGSGVLAAGLIAGGIAIPHALSHSTQNAVLEEGSGGNGVASPADGTPDPAGATSVQDPLSAYFDAGYNYNDAVELAQLWHETDITQVKTEAGTKLENGTPLPIQPSGGSNVISPADSAEADAVNAFFAAGYTYDDAVQLAKTWNTADPYHAKIEGGQKIEDGQTLPIAP